MAASVLNLTNIRKGRDYRLAVASVETAPDLNTTPRILLGPTTDNIELYVHYNGAVSAANVEMWIIENGQAYRGADTASLVALAPTSDGREVRKFYGVANKTICFILKGRTAGTSVDMRVRPVK